MESIPADRKYDLYSQTMKNDPYGLFTRMRQDDPVYCQPGIDGETMIWFLTRYADVEQLLRDSDRFVRDPLNADVLLPDQGEPLNELLAFTSNHMLNKDGADHRRLRTLVSKAFTPRRIKELRPRIETLANQLIDGVEEQGQMDLVADYAFQLPIIVISELLGIPLEDRERFKVWSNAIVSPALDDTAQARAAQLIQEFLDYLRDLFAIRRQEPQDDLISALLQAEEAGDQLNESELFSTVVLLIVAGHETTVGLISNAVVALLHQPETRAQLQENPESMKTAVEEFLRYDSPVERVLARWAAEDTEISGHEIKKGDLLIGILGSANRDPEQFCHPEKLDIHRGTSRHLAFGAGPHYCMGAPLARLEGEIALNTLLQRLPNLRFATPESEILWRTVPMFRGPVALPVVWDQTE